MSAIEPVSFCPKCRTRSEGANFCPACGTNLLAVSVALADPGRTRRLDSRSGAKTTFAIFREASVTNEQRPFAGHSAVAVFGSATIDLTAAELPPGETRINVYTVFGSVDILAFNDVGVRVTGVTTLAEVKVRGKGVGNGIFKVNEYCSDNYESAERKLHVDLVTIFAEVKIRR
jgi:hypothetical protein